MINTLPQPLINANRAVINDRFCIDEAFQCPPTVQLADDDYLIETYLSRFGKQYGYSSINRISIQYPFI